MSARVAVVTGASSGLGAESARALARAGFTVVATGRDADHLAELQDDWPGSDDTLTTQVADVTEELQVRELVAQTLDRHGRIDALVTAAGTSDGTSTFSESASAERFRHVLDTNVTGTFLITREVGRHMLDRGSGSIVMISSMTADGGMEWGPLSYTASKAAVEGMTKQLAVEWGDRNVRVNAIAPNHFVTRMTESFLADPGFRGWVESRTPMRRIGRIEEWGATVVYLATDASSYLTGQVVHLDGGISAARGTWQSTPPWRERSADGS